MRTVNIATLKQQLSAYIHMVENGNEVMITSHRNPVARLVRYEKVPRQETGIIPPSRPMNDLQNIKGTKPKGKVSGLDHLLADRAER